MKSNPRRSTRSLEPSTNDSQDSQDSQAQNSESATATRTLRRVTQLQSQPPIEKPAKAKDKEKLEDSELTKILRPYFDAIYELKDQE